MNEAKVLIVDDETSNIQIIYRIFQKFGLNFKVLSCSNSTLAQTIAEQSNPDLIILDWEMPELNGIEVLTNLKNSEITKEIPVVMATGVKLSSENLQLALSNGAIDFLRKPLDEVELVARINSALKITEYYKNKLEYEKKIAKLEEESLKNELDSKKRELTSKTLMLVNINQLYKEFVSKLKNFPKKNCPVECNIISETQSVAKEIIKIGNQQLWGELERHFDNYNEQFYSNIVKKFPNLTSNELKLCAYLRLNLSTKEISALTFQSIRSIEIARTRLRDKIGLKGSDIDLVTYLVSF